MISIKNYKDAEFWTAVIQKKMIENDDVMITAKRALRAFYNKERNDPERKYIRCDFDGGYVLFPFPDYIKTKEEAEEYFDEYERIPYRPSAYDCTGQTFTSWHKVFQKPDGTFWCYHRYSVDI